MQLQCAYCIVLRVLVPIRDECVDEVLPLFALSQYISICLSRVPDAAVPQYALQASTSPLP